MPEPRTRSVALCCPGCGTALRRIRRLPQDRVAATGIGLRRYRCGAAGCGWKGLLVRPSRGRALLAGPGGPAVLAALHDRAAAWSGWARRATLFATVAAAVAAPLLVLLLIALGALAGPKAAAAVAPGVSHDGLPLQHDAPAPRVGAGGAAPDGRADNAAGDRPLALRQGCAWGQPGRMPYQGSTEQALGAAGLPPEVVREIAALRREGRKTDRLEIRTGSIRALGDGRRFDPRSVALSFGWTMCLGSRVNFAAGHAEPADLYEVRDAQGRRHSVMVPDVCGNVSVLRALRERGVLGRLADTLAQRSADAAGVAYALAQSDPAAAPGGADPIGAGRAQPVAMAAGTSALGSGSAGGLGVKRAQGAIADSEPGAAGEPRNPLRPSGSKLSDSLLPRHLAAVALSRLSAQLARHSATVAKLADKAGPGGTSPAPGGGGPLDDRLAVPEPGTLACVLLGLALLVGIGQRGR